ncbi:peptidase M61 [Xanthomarina gelatinilytica]|uniref:M61 family metallopeptidase n=1 Tax=Xanthomarina gelatinilytica TaxID=1137281 RepID=UPI003AA7DC3F
MKTKLYILLFLIAFIGCKGSKVTTNRFSGVTATLDLVEVANDRVRVTMDFPTIEKQTAIFCIPKTVPGTYSTNNYGQFVENFKAFDTQGRPMAVTRLDQNRWQIAAAVQLEQIIYEVNDTYDIEKEGDVFSPAGTNIEADKNFMLNLYAFVGYMQAMENIPYQLKIKRPASFYPTTALGFDSESGESVSHDVFTVNRYFELTDNPILYAVADTLSFRTGDMEILLGLYSATGKYKAQDIKPALVKTMTAQKKFLGNIDNTDKYAILLYLADEGKLDARGTGALEHNNSTVVVFSEDISLENLEQSIVDVVSHEFFHILTPLNVHSEEIHNFNFNDPKMSKHLWMYEGVTEYFAQLFQVNQGLCDETEFFERMADKINTSKQFDDTVPFTLMSEHILTDAHKNSFYNVYQKGALIGMCLDIKLRELSHGKRGIRDLMQRLSKKYGKDRPFDDDKLIAEIVDMTYPEIAVFFETYVYGETPIPYNEFLEKVGLSVREKTIQTGYLFKGNEPYIDIDVDTGEIYFRKRIKFNSFLEQMGVRGGDVLKAINEVAITSENFREPILATRQWKPGMKVAFLIARNGKEIELTGTTDNPTVSEWEITAAQEANSDKAAQLRKAWLKG